MKIDIGDWIGAVYVRDKIIGYIIHNDVIRKKCTVKVIKSENHRRLQCLVIKYNEICAYTYAGLSPDDIGNLIDLALQTRDEEWFRELIHEYSLWHHVQDFFP
ncbi:IDEAL domain-containing protein [Sporolactobacillus spathodeae]|uniref:IDEAL domain-containing protein n=1 Tax=Sporolactobacillus spathodeae TaxID=1465502 RepID=A0ABS2Q603_9BACL|nr:IDEAL domain-containing protein [Sporolactobacillus spathodeae]MBM7657214.1 hypothetical protein [Sporolactobacillus spathodeae]